MTIDARSWCTDIMNRYRFRREARELILDNCDFVIEDPDGVRGGGYCRFGYCGDRTLVYLETGQHEAAVHELAHAWWFLIEVGNPDRKNLLVNRLIECFLRNADLPPGNFPLVRNHCRIYRYGDGDWPGMWMAHRDRWNHDEILAGLASLTMGNVMLYPHDLRGIYIQMYAPPQKVYVPVVMA